MADPVTLAMMGAAAGAATNKKDPLKGALLGATLGGVGGAVAPGLLAGAPAAGMTGIAPMGAQAATGLLGGAAPVAGPGVGAVLGAGAPAAAAPGLTSQMASPQALMAGASLAGSMTPQQQGPATSFPLRPTQPSQVYVGEVPKVELSPIRRGWDDPIEELHSIFDTPQMRRSWIGPDRDYLIERIPATRVLR